MAEQYFAVVFDGQTAAGADPTQVRENLAKLFKTEPARIEPMFSGNRAVIKTGLNEATARSYQTALAKAGAMTEVVAVAPKGGNGPPSPSPSPSQTASPTPAEPQAAPAVTEPAPVETPSAAAPVLAARDAPARLAPDANGNLPPPPVAPDFDVAEPGAQLADPTVVEPAKIDTSHLEMAEPGVDLSTHERVPEPQYDLSKLTLDPPGTSLT
ncbi:MAG: hypothetical protein K0U93_12525 [Gammaproteobacteria bacterium]|nr:hypothetical protein [Gammaproteobacteria bacterium]